MTPETLLTIIKIAGLFIGVSFLIFWVGLVWWVSQDVLSRTTDIIIVSAAVAITALFGPVGVLIYLVVRPRQTIKESYGEMMEREMLLHASAITICPTCNHMAQEDFVSCPYCGTPLKKACSSCARLLNMEWEHCPYCATTQQPMIANELVEEMVIAQPNLAQARRNRKQRRPLNLGMKGKAVVRYIRTWAASSPRQLYWSSAISPVTTLEPSMEMPLESTVDSAVESTSIASESINQPIMAEPASVNPVSEINSQVNSKSADPTSMSSSTINPTNGSTISPRSTKKPATRSSRKPKARA